MIYTKCYICGTEIDSLNRGAYISVDLPDSIVKVCAECNVELSGKVALVIEKEGIKTGESIFVTRRVLKAVTQNIFPDIYSIYVVPPDAVKIILQRIIELR